MIWAVLLRGLKCFNVLCEHPHTHEENVALLVQLILPAGSNSAHPRVADFTVHSPAEHTLLLTLHHQNAKQEIPREKKIKLSTNIINEGLKPVLAPSFSLPIPEERCGLGQGSRPGSQTQLRAGTAVILTLLLTHLYSTEAAFPLAHRWPSDQIHPHSLHSFLFEQAPSKKSSALDHSAPSSFLA